MNTIMSAIFAIVLLIFNASGAYAAGPELEIPSGIPADAGGTVTVPVNYTANGNAISSIIFSVDFDENNLGFDPAMTMGFPWPDAITVNPLINPFVFSVGITYDGNDTDGELDFTFSDITPPLTALPEGELVSITFTINPAATSTAPVIFSQDPPASFGNTDGQSISGVTIGGSVLITPVCNPTGTQESICNGVDDDCDTLIDEDFTPSPTNCGAGECAATGQTSCVGSVEGDTCTPGTPSSEVCDNLDNDCDGAIDEDLNRATNCGTGECGAAGEESCSAGVWGNDTCTPGSPSAEVCEGSLDENCDSVVDDGCSCTEGETRSCGSDTGECESGTETCAGGSWSGTCVGEVGPSAETCDNLDNDCDGAIDEDLNRATICGTGECGAAGEETCSAGVWGNDTCSPLTPTAEVCDNLDNDCDGSVDENLTRQTTCGSGECAGNTGEETCTAGTWGGDTCDPYDGAQPEGPSGDATCGDTLDNDCDEQTDAEDIDCQEDTELFDWGVNIDEITYCLFGPCDFDVEQAGNITGPEDLPPFIDTTNFDFTTGLGSISIALSDPGSHSVVLFVDHDIKFPLNGFVNETGFAVGNPDAAQTWEIDEPGNGSTQFGSIGFPYFGDIFFDNFLFNTLDNLAFYDAIDDQTLTPPDDVSMALGWDFELVEGESATTVFLLSDTSIPQGFHLVHNDPDSDANIYFSSSLQRTENVEMNCFDKADDDGDGLTDCADPDCDGATNGSCDTGQAGICSTGTTTCQSEASLCVPDSEAEPNDVTCDGIDNDCDGQTDEDFQETPTTCGTGACEGNEGQMECQNGSEVDTCDPLAGAIPEGPTGNITCTDRIDNDCDGLVDTDDTTCENAKADVFLKKLKSPRSVTVKKDKKKTRKIKAFGITDTIAQKATVRLSVNSIDALSVNIHPESRTRSVAPGDNPKKFKFKADITCNETGSWKLHWTATIDAPQNADTSNDTMRASTIVTCKKDEHNGSGVRHYWWKIKSKFWYFFQPFVSE